MKPGMPLVLTSITQNQALWTYGLSGTIRIVWRVSRARIWMLYCRLIRWRSCKGLWSIVSFLWSMRIKLSIPWWVHVHLLPRVTRLAIGVSYSGGLDNRDRACCTYYCLSWTVTVTVVPPNQKEHNKQSHQNKPKKWKS